MTSRIDDIVDYTAARAGSAVSGLAAVFGSGSSGTSDPLRSGQTIRPAPGAPTQEFEHWSEVAALQTSEWLTQDGAMRMTWVLPMRLWLGRADLARLRATAQPFFAAYLGAFQSDHTLGGLAMTSRVSRMELGDDPPRGPGQARWGWLDTTLLIEELVDPPGEPS